MALDANLFTLVLTPVKGDPALVDLVDPNGEVHYRKRFISAQPTYEMSIFDPLTDALLCTVKGTNPLAKQKTIELFNPNVTVSFQQTGTLTFKWTFEWEGHEFEWKKEACFLIRKPDPPVIVCSCDAPQTSKRSALQILDYNLQRFDIEDRKGLEICIIAGLLSFYDQQEESNRLKQPGVVPLRSSPPQLTPQPSAEHLDVKKDLPPPPSAPVPRDGNEIFIMDDVPIDDYVQQCGELLKEESFLFIILRAQSITTVPKCVQVAEAIKRYIYRTSDSDEELHQYVTTDEKSDGKSKGKGKHRINLDQPVRDTKHEYQYLGPPQSLTIHLSKIPMPELQPKAAPKPAPPPRVSPTPYSQSSPTLSKDGRLQKPDKGKQRADPSPERMPDSGRGRERADAPPAPIPRPDKGKGKERPVTTISNAPPADFKPDKGKGRADGRRHQPSPSVPQLKVDTSSRPSSAPQPRPQSYHPPSSAPQPNYRPPPPSQQYPLPPPNRPQQSPSGGPYLQPSPMPYGVAPGPYAVYRPQGSPGPGPGPYLTPYPPGQQPGMQRVQSDNGPSMFDKFFRTHSR
ncbi:hypothetical protein CALVIDRAFT_594408 [Calocera viscosa TUFC12733]|uniref:Uncharacterized protein n=1 Tax=Calocera viscosa (strain TUFC12733) TaxID=1330018 RepID=A0A167S9T3_CALVF|nr:hypothetical protein CALVIDRAFT_594408 [Calocera viscosa TUFC12733]